MSRPTLPAIAALRPRITLVRLRAMVAATSSAAAGRSAAGTNRSTLPKAYSSATSTGSQVNMAARSRLSGIRPAAWITPLAAPLSASARTNGVPGAASRMSHTPATRTPRPTQ